MKQTHSNQEETSRNQGSADNNKKTNKGQTGKNAGTDQNTHSSAGGRDHSSAQTNDSSNWQKDKQGSKK
jgi:hypothetical protein